MTKAELINALEPFPDYMDVFMDERVSDFRYGLLNSVTSKEINFSEDPDGPVLSSDAVIILSEE